MAFQHIILWKNNILNNLSHSFLLSTHTKNYWFFTISKYLFQALICVILLMFFRYAFWALSNSGTDIPISRHIQIAFNNFTYSRFPTFAFNEAGSKITTRFLRNASNGDSIGDRAIIFLFDGNNHQLTVIFCINFFTFQLVTK